MNTCLHIQAEQLKDFLQLQQELKLNVHCLHTDSITLADMREESVCLQILQDFATRIQAKNLTCATSLFVKYWATIWLLPFLYSHAISLPFIKWQSSALVVELPETWHWDRTLQLKDTALPSIQIMPLQDIERILYQLRVLFQHMAKVGRVPYALLWENAAVRVVQFYHALAQQPLSAAVHARLKQQQELVKSQSAHSFGLAENPFVCLWNHWHSNLQTYMRQKCCFYFQLEVAEQALCRNCPLQLK